MSLKLSSLKRWLTLEDAAKYLSLVFGDTVEPKDLIQVAIEGKLALSVMLSETLKAVKYKLNESPHEPLPALPDRDQPAFLLAKLDLINRFQWALLLDINTFYEPDFSNVWKVTGLWGFPCLENSVNLEILSRKLANLLNKHEDVELEPAGHGPIIIEQSKTGERMGLVELNEDAFGDGYNESRPSSNYNPVYCLSDKFFLGIAQAELQRFANSFDEIGSDNAHQDALPADTDDETETKRLNRTVAALALGLMKKHGTYNRNGEPNASQLAKLATEHLRDAASDRTPHGFSETTVRNTITAALNACPELKG